MQTNDLTIRKETVLSPVFQGTGMLCAAGKTCSPSAPLLLTQEQSVELDYVLPDYYPDFFRLLFCTADAAVTGQSVSEGILQYTLRVQLHVLYCGEANGESRPHSAPMQQEKDDENRPRSVQSLTQQLDYSGQITLPQEYLSAENMQIRISAEPSYLNCRAVSQRRIDLRGAVKICVQLSGERRKEILSGAEGLHIQTRSVPVNYVAQMIQTEKQFLLSDEIRISEAQPALLSVLRTQAVLSVSDTRIVAGLLVVKGEAAVTLLYTSSAGIESLSAVLPFSQIAEPEGITDDMPCMVTALLAEQTVTPEAERSGDIRLLHCDLQIVLQCAAVRTAQTELLTDLYSTVHPAELVREPVSMLTAPVPVTERLQLKASLSQPDAVLTKVYAAWAVTRDLQTTADASGNGMLLSGRLDYCVLAADAENHPLMLEQQEPFTWELPHLSPASLLPPVMVQNCAYTLAGSDTVSVQAELSLSGQVMQMRTVPLLTDVLIDPEKRLPATDHYALRLYFAQPDESLWEIAKRYHTSESAIREENEIPAESLSEAQMLLIPIVQ